MKAKILVVEDEKILAIGMKRKLEILGYTVTGLASSGPEAIEKAQNTSPDLILMDIVLKGDMDGVETAQQIINLYDIPVIYLTAYSDDEILKRAMVTEPYGYLLKPLNVDELRANIRMALYKHKTEISRKELLKNRIMDDYYHFMIETMGDSTDKSESEIRDMLLLTFEKSFEDKMKRKFEEDLEKADINLHDENTSVLFEAYLFWISKLFKDLGIKNQVRSHHDSWYLEFRNCPWMKHSTKNPIFCINCNGMINSSFKWTNLEGNIDVISRIANNSSKCSFRFH